MKVGYCLVGLASLTLIAACSNAGESSSSSDNQSTSSEVSSSEVISSESSSSSLDSSSSSEVDEAAEIYDFLDKLEKVNGHPNKANVNVTTSYYFLTDSDPLEISSVDTFTLDRYSRENASDISIRSGSYYMDDPSESTSYETQTFASGNYLYQLTKEEGVAYNKASLAYTIEAVEPNIGFSLYYGQLANLELLISYLDDSSYVAEYSLPSVIPSNGEISFSYSLALMASSNLIDTKISHSLSISIEDNIITSYSYDYSQDQYAGGVKANWSESHTECEFSQGEYSLFEGEVWDPSDFPNS